jgi:hypothetical protein
MFGHAYDLRTDAPPPMAWDTYKALIHQEWSELLEWVTQQDSFEEGAIQRFLEQHPCLIPGAFPEGTTSHWPYPSAVITQPPLTGLRTRIPDFMWLATDSAGVYPTLIEIESPNKPWWTEKSEVPHHQFTQAWDQLEQWKTWFADPLNVQNFQRTYRLGWPVAGRPIKPRYWLIYGRRAEANRSDWLMQRRAAKGDDDMMAMTFDRLAPQADASNFLCVKMDVDQYVAVTVPPTLRLGPCDAHSLANIKEKGAAVARSPYLNADRKQFLMERFPYWDGLAVKGIGVHSTADWE